MRAQARDPDLEEICRGHGGTIAPVKFSLRSCGIIVHAEDALHREAIEQSIGDHLPPTANLLRWLKDQVGRAFELSARGQILWLRPSSMVVCPSWPQACMTPGLVDA